MKTIFISTIVAILVVVGFARFDSGNTAKAFEETKIDIAELFGKISEAVSNAVESFVESEVARRVKEQMKFGAVSGPELFFESWTVNGVKTYFFNQPMISGANNGTTTPCQIKLPPASTTLQHLSAVFTAGPTTTGRFLVYDVNTDWATSTRKVLFAVSDINASGGRLLGTTTMVATTTNQAGQTGTIIQGSSAGNTRWILFDLLGGSSPFIGSGQCNVELREI